MFKGRGGGGGGLRPPQPQQQTAGPTEQEIEALFEQTVAGAVEQCRGLFEARLVALEGLVEQQQTQIQQLQQLGVLEDRLSQLAHEVSALHLDHSKLKDDSQAESECLIAAGVLQVQQVHCRSRICQSLSAFGSMTESRERMQLMKAMLGGQGIEIAALSMTARAFKGAGKTVADKPHATNGAADLDDAAWEHIRDYDPPRSDLDKWEKSVTVNNVIGGLKVEGIIGKTDVLKFSDVLKVFSQLGMTLEQFVEKFTTVRRSRSSEELMEMATTVLKRFAPQHAGRDVMNCRELYRLLEVVGYPLERFKSIYNGADEPEALAQQLQKLGGYRIRGQIGQGKRVCYLGEHVSDQNRVAIKWPASRDELLTLKDLQRVAPKGCLGLPKLLAHGESQGEPYFVTALLGSSLGRVFQSLDSGPAERRWSTLRVFGRLVVRRLQAFHALGYVHCDVSPENIVLGRAEGTNGSARYTLYLVDFEHTQKYPGGMRLPGDCGSAEWSSIRSGDGGERAPEDDLEALGWVLMNGFFGDLPWFSWLSMSYKDWDSQWTRHQTLKQVQLAKAHFLKTGWRAFSCRKSVKMPAELANFIPACRPDGAEPGKPDYDSLLALLGGSKELSCEEAEQRDLGELMEHIALL
mmetsp:Transcript_86159/g.238822  ORF Transcript_86159/g.238822 Transcript_86159/m.238822 type:complete len:634 (+) Transcript_86159:70-1971(+)